MHQYVARERTGDCCGASSVAQAVPYMRQAYQGGMTRKAKRLTKFQEKTGGGGAGRGCEAHSTCGFHVFEALKTSFGRRQRHALIDAWIKC